MLAIQIQSIQNTKITTADLTIRDKIGGIRGRFYRGGRRIDAWPPIQIKRTRSPPIRDAKVNGAEWQGRGRKLTAFPKRTRIKRTLLLCTKRSSVRNSINTVQVSRLRFPLPRRNLVSTHPSRHRWQIVSTTAYFETFTTRDEGFFPSCL